MANRNGMRHITGPEYHSIHREAVIRSGVIHPTVYLYMYCIHLVTLQKDENTYRTMLLLLHLQQTIEARSQQQQQQQQSEQNNGGHEPLMSSSSSPLYVPHPPSRFLLLLPKNTRGQKQKII